MNKKWLTIVGIGDDGVPGLGLKALVAVQNAAVIFGGERHLAMMGSSIQAEKVSWPQPFSEGIAQIVALRGQKVTVLASGDPMFYGVGNVILRHIPLEEVDIIPHPSSFSYASARLGWPLQEVDCLSIHGRPLKTIAPNIKDGAKLFILANDEMSASELAEFVIALGLEKSTFHILEHLGGMRETITSLAVGEIGTRSFADLSVIAIDCAGDGASVHRAGNTVLPDSAFLHDGQLTKQDVRAIVLAHLAPGQNEILWDIGAGCGSISIEWLRLGMSCRAFAVERDKERCSFIQRNKEVLDIAGLEVIEAVAPNGLGDLDAPHAIFIGGGFQNPDIGAGCWQALRPGGRLVATAVTLETEASFQQFSSKVGAHLIRLGLSHLEPLGASHVWRPNLPITLMVAQKPRG